MVDFRGLEFHTGEPVYCQIVRHLKRQILLGTAENGETMPSRRELAAQTGINPNTAQKAYKLMEEEGIVRTNGNTASTIYLDDRLYGKIEDEMCSGLVSDFVAEAKRNNLSYKKVIALVSELWGDE
ncbi:MAG: GntR family transcriptional regulator [Clostridia bacterium]|nr:GntR family transcriptional regulator [Clostridia bacterium]